MEWLRWHHGAVSDDKWPLVARKSGQSVAVVIAVWAALLECASQADDRGSIEDFDPESVDALMQIADGSSQSVLDALSEGRRPRIVAGRIANWEKRQVLREREDNSTDRVRNHRERLKAALENDNGPCNADETPPEHQETPRTEQNREEKNIKPPVVPGDEDPAPAPGAASGGGDFLAEMDMGFHEFMAAYPEHRREPAADAAMAWRQLARERQLPGLPKLLHSLTDWEDSDQWRKDNGQFVPQAGNFLRKRLFLSAPPRASPGGMSVAEAERILSECGNGG